MQWGRRIVRAWEEGWMELPIEIGDRLGAAVLGAAPGQVVVGDSTTVCFYKLVSAALDARRDRREIVTDLDNFPTDRYVLEGLARARGLELRWLRFDREAGPTAAALAGALRPDTARSRAAVRDAAGAGAERGGSGCAAGRARRGLSGSAPRGSR